MHKIIRIHFGLGQPVGRLSAIPVLGAALTLSAALVLSACAQPTPQIIQPTPVPLSPMPSLVPTLTVLPTRSPHPTKRPTATSIPPLPTATRTSAPTLTPNLTPSVPPVSAGTPLPQPLAAIGPENAAQVQELARWGKGRVNDMAYSPDGQWLALATTLGVRLYETQTFAEVRYIEMLTVTTAVAFSAEGQVLAASLADGQVMMWDVAQGTVLTTLLPSKPLVTVTDLTFSPTGLYLAIATYDQVSGEDKLTVWQQPLGQRQVIYQNNSFRYGLQILHFAPNEKLLFVRGDNQLYSIELEVPWRQTLLLPEQEGTGWTLTPDGTVAIVQQDYDYGWVGVYTVASNALRYNFNVDPHFDYIRLPATCEGDMDYIPGSLIFHVLPDGQRFGVRLLNGTVELRRMADGVLERTFPEKFNQLEFAPDGATFAGETTEGVMGVWRVADGTPLATFTGYFEEFIDVDVAPDGQLIAAAASWGGGKVRVWRTDNGERLYTLNVTAKEVAFSPDGQWLAVGRTNGHIDLWRVAEGTQAQTLTGHTAEITDLAFAPNGQLLASVAWDCTARVWQLPEGTLAQQAVLGIEAQQVAFSPQSNWVALSGYFMQLWKVGAVPTLREIGLQQENFGLPQFLPNGQLVLISGALINFYQMDEGTLARSMQVATAATGAEAYPRRFAPDARLIAGLVFDENTRRSSLALWDATSGALLHYLPGHTDNVTKIVFSADNRLMITASEDGTIRLWGVRGK